METHYKFIKEHQLLVQKTFGNYSIEDYISYINSIYTKENMLHVKKVITDLRGTNLELAFKDIDKLVELREQIILFEYVNVNIVDTPTSNAVVHLYQKKITDKRLPKHKQHYCSTPQMAIDLLQIDMPQEELTNLLDSF
ncbi:hypothetical protein [Wenyingzhuangia aestuarii]|uniref:hypothetical protein n=1 Tax=Wenyingzhuangia aestuarii TaxID=1647582 RepID=UPI00143B9C86|nr:hypothetical protein [Wenyingzhuangia aestuarii]NJB81911.1 hypothetical protein [Wenyingzhuangia aestuarii]